MQPVSPNPAIEPRYYQAAPGRGLHIAAIVVGIVGILGIIPILFWLGWILGVIAVVLGVMAFRQGRRHGVRQGRAGIILGLIAFGFGCLGFAALSDAFSDLEEDLESIEAAE
jgi:hypothetical protein